jgi:signal recognition particle receptor subunit beta
MPLVDHRTNSVVLRIVYDGPPDAGKTTNLQRLGERLSLSRRATPYSRGGHERVQFFDWLDVNGGMIGNHRMRCQLVTVPGQLQLAPRRRHILDSADAVVFIADSQASSMPQTDAALRSLARGLGTRADVPLVLQANKQDLPRACAPGELHASLGLAARVPAIGAQAAGGPGVLETFLLAVRLAVDHVRALLVAGELGEADPNSAADLLSALDTDAPELFMALEAIARTADAMAAGEAPRPTAHKRLAERLAAAPSLPEPPPFPGTDDDRTWDLPAVKPGALVTRGVRREPEPIPPIAIGRRGTPRSVLAVPPDGALESAQRGTPPPSELLAFRLPPIDLPAGMVWPCVAGRAALAALGTPVRVVPQPAPWAPTAAIELACGEGWSAHTGPDLVFPDGNQSWPALLEAIRWQTKLTYFAPPGRTYALSPEGEGMRLWVLTPTYRTVWVAIEDAFAYGDLATAARLARTGLEAVDELRARGLPIADLDHIAIDEPLRFLATPWTTHRDRLTGQLQRLLSASIL